jgi:hypothetical protein
MRTALFWGLTLLVAGTGPACAWDEYVYRDLGIAKEFPAEPRRTMVTYKAPMHSRDTPRVAGENRSAVQLETQVGGIVYRMQVADFRDKLENSANIFSECLYLAEQAGEEIDNVHMGVGGDDSEVYGRLATVDLYQNSGRLQTACFFNNGRLYRIEAHILPTHPDKTDPQAST